MKTLSSLIRYHHSLGPATSVNCAAFAPILTSKQPTPSRLLLYIPNSTTVTLCTLTFLRLQHIQNSLARTVANTPKYPDITPILESVHWLKIEQRILYKLEMESNRTRTIHSWFVPLYDRLLGKLLMLCRLRVGNGTVYWCDSFAQFHLIRLLAMHQASCNYGCES